MRSKLGKKVLSWCLGVSMVASSVVLPAKTEVKAADPVADWVEDGALWRFTKGKDDGGWYIQNEKTEQYLASEEGIALSDTPYQVACNLQTDQTYSFDFGGFAASVTKKYLAVGTGDKLSLGESVTKYTQLLEKKREGNKISYVKTSQLAEGKDYVLAMARRSSSEAATAENSQLFALTNEINGTGSAARMISREIDIQEDGTTTADGTGDANVLAKPMVTFAAPVYGEVVPQAAAILPAVEEGAYTAVTTWSPSDEKVKANTEYTATVTITATGDHYFTEAQVPKTVSLGQGEMQVLGEQEASLNETGKVLSITHTFAALEDGKQDPEYTVPTGLKACVGDTLADVTLPDGFSFESPLTTVLSTQGTANYTVTYTPEDTEQYRAVTGIPVAIHVSLALETMEAQNVLWKFTAGENENEWYIQNAATETYLAGNPYIYLQEEPFAVTAEKQEDGSYTFNFGGTKPYLSVGSGMKYSLGEQHYKDVQLFEKKRTGSQVTYEKTGVLEEGPEYLITMVYRTDTATSANASATHALTSQLQSAGTDAARILSYTIDVSESKVAVSDQVKDANLLGRPEIIVREPAAGEKQKDAKVSIPYAEMTQYETETVWEPAGETFEVGKAYQTTITIRATGEGHFDENSLPRSMMLQDGTKIKLSENQAQLSENQKEITVVYAFEKVSANVKVYVSPDMEHGMVIAPEENVKSGDTVSLLVVPEEGYQVESLKVLAGEQEVNCEEAEDGAWTFVMPAEDVLVTATFCGKKYQITAEAASHGSVKSNVESAEEGTVVKVEAVPAEAYMLKRLSVWNKVTEEEIETKEENGSCTFTMPAADVLLRAEFYKPEVGAIVEDSEHGSVELFDANVAYGSNVFVTVKAQEGFELESLKVVTDQGEVEVQKVDEELYIFVMPGRDVKIQSVFTEKKAKPEETPKDEPKDEQKDNPKVEPKLKAPVLAELKSKKTGDVQVAWSPVDGAEGYEVYRVVGGKDEKLQTTTELAYLDKAPKAGAENAYYVIALAKDTAKNSVTSDKKTIVIPKAATKVKVSRKNQKMVVKFKKVKGATGYLVYRATKKKGTYKMVGKVKKNTFTDKKAKANKKYYYKVVTVAGKVYSPASKIVAKK